MQSQEKAKSFRPEEATSDKAVQSSRSTADISVDISGNIGALVAGIAGGMIGGGVGVIGGGV